MQAYCLKCRDRREIQDPDEVTLKNGSRFLVGDKLFRLVLP